MSAAAAALPPPGPGGVLRALRIVGRAALYEQRKAAAFRGGFVVRELLRGVSRPVAMVFVFQAMMRSSGRDAIGGYDALQLVQYMILVATLQKVTIDEKATDLADQIFEGYVTKYLVMPVRLFTLVLGRWVQFTLLQLAIAAVFWILGMLVLPRWWPVPPGPQAVVQALVLVVLGSYCYLLLYFVLQSLAFWLDRVWSLLVMARFVAGVVSGALVPISLMPSPLPEVFAWTFPYWGLFAPAEILLGRSAPGAFSHGLLVLGLSLGALQTLATVTWRRGLSRYCGVGM